MKKDWVDTYQDRSFFIVHEGENYLEIWVQKDEEGFSPNCEIVEVEGKAACILAQVLMWDIQY